jgi:hypothetical protein
VRRGVLLDVTIDPVAVVLVATFNRGHCRRCPASVVWYQTVGGSWLPFNGNPRVDRVRRDASLAGSPIVGEIARGDLHWRTCVGHARDRNRRGSRA